MKLLDFVLFKINKKKIKNQISYEKPKIFGKTSEKYYEKDIELSVFKMNNGLYIDKRPIYLSIKNSRFNDLPEEIISNILRLASSKVLLNLRKCGRYFQTEITLFMIKRKMLENRYRFNLLRQTDDEFYRDIKLNYNNTNNTNNTKYEHIDKPTNEYVKEKMDSLRRHNCLNADCINKDRYSISSVLLNIKAVPVNYCLGMIYFYYPPQYELEPPHDDENDSYGTNYEHVIRQRQCANAPYNKQYIPYCEDCMVELDILYKRADGLETPFGYKNGNIIN